MLLKQPAAAENAAAVAHAGAQPPTTEPVRVARAAHAVGRGSESGCGQCEEGVVERTCSLALTLFEEHVGA